MSSNPSRLSALGYPRRRRDPPPTRWNVATSGRTAAIPTRPRAPSACTRTSERIAVRPEPAGSSQFANSTRAVPGVFQARRRARRGGCKRPRPILPPLPSETCDQARCQRALPPVRAPVAMTASACAASTHASVTSRTRSPRSAQVRRLPVDDRGLRRDTSDAHLLESVPVSAAANPSNIGPRRKSSLGAR